MREPSGGAKSGASGAKSGASGAGGVTEELLAAAAAAVEAARRAGAKDAWAAAERSRDVSFEVRNGKLEKVEDSTSRELSLRLFVDGRYSAHTTTDLRPDRVAAFAAAGVAITRALQPDPHRRLAEPARYPRQLPALELDDARVGQLDRDARLAWLRAMDERITGAPKVISASSSVFDGTSAVAAASSNGFSHAYETTTVGCGASITLDDGDKRPEDGMFALRQALDVYANLRPFRAAGIDLLIVRELVGGLYFGERGSRPDGTVFDTCEYRPDQVERLPDPQLVGELALL